MFFSLKDLLLFSILRELSLLTSLEGIQNIWWSCGRRQKLFQLKKVVLWFLGSLTFNIRGWWAAKDPFCMHYIFDMNDGNNSFDISRLDLQYPKRIPFENIHLTWGLLEYKLSFSLKHMASNKVRRSRLHVTFVHRKSTSQFLLVLHNLLSTLM